MSKKFKWIGFIIAFVLMIFLGSTFKSTTLINRAIIVGMGIDKDGDDLVISTQILVPTVSDSPTNKSNIITAKAKTISGALAKVSEMCSMIVALAHCNVVILGENILKNDAYFVLDYLTRNAYLSPNAKLIASEESPEAIFKTSVAFSELASFFAQRTISSYGNFKGIVQMTIKQYIANYHSYSSANWLSIIKKMETSNETIGSSGKPEKQYVFDLTSTVIIKKDSAIYKVDETGTSGLNYFLSKIDRGAFYLKGEDGSDIELYLLEKKAKNKFDLITKTVNSKISFVVVLKEVIRKKGSQPFPPQNVKLSEKETENLKEIISQSIFDVFEEGKKNRVDILNFYGSFYKKYGKRWSSIVKDDSFLNDIKLNIDINIKYK